MVKSKIVSILNATAILLLLYLILKAFEMHVIVLDRLKEFINAEWHISTIVVKPANIIIFFLVIWISILAGRVISALLEEDILPKKKFKKGIPYTIALLRPQGVS